MDRANQFRDNRQQSRNRLYDRLQRALRPGGRARNQCDLHTRFAPQTQDGGHGVFLRAADDESRDNVRDSHGALRMSYFLSSCNRAKTLAASAVFVLALAR